MTEGKNPSKRKTTTMKRKVVKFPENKNIWIDVETGCIINNYTVGANDAPVQRVYNIDFDGHKTRISNNGEQYALHRLVAFTFSTKRGNWDRFYRMDVHHIDCNRFNNHFSNLIVLDTDSHRDYHHIGRSIEAKIKLAQAARRTIISLMSEWEEVSEKACAEMDK